MKDYKNILIGSLLVMAVLISPSVSFAKEKEREREDKKEYREEHSKFNNWMSSWFKNNSGKNTKTTPTISNVTVTSTKSTKATISWDTDVRSNSMIWYGKTSPVDTSSTASMKRGDRVLKHKFEIKKLEPNTTYYVIVGSATSGGTSKSNQISFTTGSTVINSDGNPTISEIETRVSGTTTTISWETNEATTGTVFYSTSSPVDTNTASKVENTSLKTKHSLTIPNLASNTLYHFIIKSVDASNNSVSSSEAVFYTN